MAVLLRPIDCVDQSHVPHRLQAVRVLTIGLKHIAVKLNLILAERLHIDDATQAAANQSADFVGMATDFAHVRIHGQGAFGGGTRQIEYSAVTQPRPESFMSNAAHQGKVAVHITRVLPHSMSTGAFGASVKWRVMRTGRSSSTLRPSARIIWDCQAMSLISTMRPSIRHPLYAWIATRQPSSNSSAMSFPALHIHPMTLWLHATIFLCTTRLQESMPAYLMRDWERSSAGIRMPYSMKAWLNCLRCIALSS